MAKEARTTAAYTTEFHHEFRVETGRLLRRRFLWFSGLLGGLSVVSLLLGLVGTVLILRSSTDPAGSDQAIYHWEWWALAVLWTGMYLASFGYALQRRPTDRALLRLSLWVVTIDGLINLTMRAMGLPGALDMSAFTVTHIIACLFLPWTAFQALQPMAIVLSLNAAWVFLMRHPQWQEKPDWEPVLWLLPTPLLAVPGTALCWFRHSRRTQLFKIRFMTSRYSEMRRELVDARRIHESLFPKPFDTGGVRLVFEYEPMRQIGGDFLYANRQTAAGAFSPVSIVLLDVTGHGIPAALTVNRLHGEMERVFAENPDVGPGEVLSLLNRYVHLTLATHSIYVTAFCVRVDPARSALEYASGGHPPAFVRAVDGTIEELTSTAFVLGACPDEAFDPGLRELRFGPGDTLIAYTDGAIEAKGEDGRMLRIDGLRHLITAIDGHPPERWAGALCQQIAAFRGGPPADDTLFFTLHRPVTVTPVPAGEDRTAARPAGVGAEISA
ncbi:MAG TPA: PP2C family protein-serine/threonine phosphatase [Phycisphaerales bacterium]|nr:PP2C family protein-serine/threonine phosphatase [Phycisphaerales bacterium]